MKRTSGIKDLNAYLIEKTGMDAKQREDWRARIGSLLDERRTATDDRKKEIAAEVSALMGMDPLRRKPPRRGR